MSEPEVLAEGTFVSPINTIQGVRVFGRIHRFDAKTARYALYWLDLQQPGDTVWSRSELHVLDPSQAALLLLGEP